MSLQKKNLGKIGENLAANYLASKNYKIFQRNFRAPQYGEVDIIAQKGELLIFVEVKTRLSDEFGRPEEAISKGKLHELKKMVDYYFLQNPQTKLSPQIDVVSIMLSADLEVDSLEHFENITL